MSSERRLLARLFLVVLLLIFGAAIFTVQSTNDANTSHGISLRDILNSSPSTTTASGIIDIVAGYLISWSTVLSTNTELVFYGSITLFGILMMGLAIGRATSPPKDKTDPILEVLKQEKEKAEHLARLKSEFLNQVSHELRTPLAVMIGYLECMTDGLYGEIAAKHQEILQVVAKQSAHLKEMIDQILIYSRLEARRQPITVEDFVISQVVEDMRDTFEFLCKQKGLDLKWELPDESIILRSDPDRLKEIISNLLQNAVKYTDHGSISVRLQSLTASDSIVLEVSDTGVGIAEHYLSTIFEPFIQAHKTSTANSRGGIGLGLSIVRKHLEEMNGTVTVESELGKGSTFRVILPRVYEPSRRRRKQFLGLIQFPYRRSEKAPQLLRPRSGRGAQASRTDRAAG